MSAFGWITTGHRRLVASFLRRRTPRYSRSRVSVPKIESLETIDLLSGLTALAVHPATAKPAVLVAQAPAATKTTTAAMSNVATMAVTETSMLQTAVVPKTLTNFSLPFTPPVALFDPTLGTLVSVTITASASLNSQILSENTSVTTPADITGVTNGSFEVTGLGTTNLSGSLNGMTATVHVDPFDPTKTIPPGSPPNFTGPSAVAFPPLMVTKSLTPPPLTDAASLAFYTASAGRTSISPVLTANASSSASAPNGNLLTAVRTQGTGVVTVTYNYIPGCPPVTNLVRFGIHHQPTQIQLTFGGPLDPTQASNPAYYTVIAPNANGSFTGPGTRTIPISSAVYNPANNTVLLTTSRQLNVHYLFELEINLPCSNGNPTIIKFGTKYSLGGFTNHLGQFVPVSGGMALTPNGPRPLPSGHS